jgi:DNA-binding response OmpR family regulator
MMLEAKGYDVVTANNVRDGYDLIVNSKPELIILDVMMEEPDDGFYLALKLRKNAIKTPIIMLTSVSKALGMEFGPGSTNPVDEFLEKPIPPSVLLEKVQYQLTKSEGK